MVFNFMYISGHPVEVVSANMAKYFPFQNSLGSFHDDTFPHNLPRNPLVWTCDDVKWWLQWTIVEFSLDVFDVEKINFDGRQLASMDQLSFCAIFPEYVGDVLWQHLASLIRSVEYTPSSSCNIPAKYKGRGDNKGDSWEFPCFDISGVQSRYDFLEGSLSPWTFYSHDHPRTSYQRPNFSEICSAFNFEPTAQEYHQNFSRLPSCMYESSSENLPVIHASFSQLPVQGFNHMTSTKDSKTIVSRSIGQGPIQLWEFLLELLLDPRLSDVIAWTGDGWEFKLINPEAVAELWGRKKCKPRMNYEKLSRGLRYYYDKKIIIKTAGKRYVYRFVCDMRQLVHCDSPQELYSRCKTNYKNSFYNFYSC